MSATGDADRRVAEWPRGRGSALQTGGGEATRPRFAAPPPLPRCGWTSRRARGGGAPVPGEGGASRRSTTPTGRRATPTRGGGASLFFTFLKTLEGTVFRGIDRRRAPTPLRVEPQPREGPV